MKVTFEWLTGEKTWQTVRVQVGYSQNGNNVANTTAKSTFGKT